MRDARSCVAELHAEQIDRDAWSRLLAASAAATPFHSIGWLEALERSYESIEGRVLVVEGDNGYSGAFPFAVQTRLGFLSRILSLPFGTYGGPVVAQDSPRDISKTLWNAFHERIRTARVLSAQVVDLERDTLSCLSHGYKAISTFTHRISLASEYRDVHREVYSQNIRKMIRQSRERGVRVEEVTNEKGVGAYAEIAAHTLDRRGAKVYSEELFMNAFRLMKKECVFHLAFHEDRPVAGTVHFCSGDSIMNWLTASYPEHWHLRPNNALVDAAIRWAIERGMSDYDFGGTPEGAEGLRRYKESWGAKRHGYVVHARESRALWALRRGQRLLRSRS